MNYYNEHDTKAAAWLRQLILAGLIPNGDVDERGIEDVRPEELRGYTQCHFFAGIGGWSLALQLAGWPEDRPVWTGSCPCQPFSVAGRGRGTDDERHLWPVFAELIRSCKPPVVFGEQVASKAGRDWLAGVFADLEGMAYQRAGADLCAAGVGAPHIRQRLYWVADSSGSGFERAAGSELQGRRSRLARSSKTSGLADASSIRCIKQRRTEELEIQRQRSFGTREHKEPRGDWELSRGVERLGFASGSTWTNSRLIQCRDGKTRRIPIEPSFFPLADGLSPARMGILRGAGNAIVPQVAAEFVGAYLDVAEP